MSTLPTAFVLSPLLQPSATPWRPRISSQSYRLVTCNPSRRSHLPLMQASPEASSSKISAPSPIPSKLECLDGFALTDLPQFSFVDLPPNAELFDRPAAYAIRDAQNNICYMGYSKNTSAKLNLHASLVPEKCIRFQVYVPDMPKTEITAQILENVLEFWVRENGGVPAGNTVDRHMWEKTLDRKQRKQRPSKVAQPRTTQETPKSSEQDIPTRKRTTPRRTSSRRDRTNADPFSENFRSSVGSSSRQNRRKRGPSWEAADGDYVEVDVDPLDPFSASKRGAQGSGRPWDFQTEDESVDEDWMPILALTGCAGLIWLFGMLSNALPAATPSMGM